MPSQVLITQTLQHLIFMQQWQNMAVTLDDVTQCNWTENLLIVLCWKDLISIIGVCVCLMTQVHRVNIADTCSPCAKAFRLHLLIVNTCSLFIAKKSFYLSLLLKIMIPNYLYDVLHSYNFSHITSITRYFMSYENDK